MSGELDGEDLTAAAIAGDPSAFERITTLHRRELHVHCYRMLGSFHEAEDAVQDTLLRAWRSLDTIEDRGMLRAWLYRIATNVCLDMLRRRSRRAVMLTSFAEVPWLEPYPDVLLDEMTTGGDPGEALVRRETIELAFIAALQALPPRQRAVFIARDVLGWPASDTAEALAISVAAANSALQRARLTMHQQLPSRRTDWAAHELTAEERQLLDRFIDAHERCDAAAAIAIAATDIRVTMPPVPACFDGIDAVSGLLVRAFGPERDGDWRLVPTSVNRMPAAASYLRRPGDSLFRAFKLDVLRIDGRQIDEITTFGISLFPALGLPDVL